MMYLSHLLINVGSNPDRPRPGRQWLRNIYHVHQRLWMAFPTPEQAAEDPDFLRPFDPICFDRPRFLFRVDNSVEDNSPRAMILVQSDAPPDWSYAFRNADILLAAPPQSRQYDPAFSAGEQLRFRIRVNLSKKSLEYRSEKAGKIDICGRPKSQGKRVALTWNHDEDPEEVIKAWFTAKGRRRGFAVDDFHLLSLGWVVGYKPKVNGPADAAENNGHAERRMKFRAALMEGKLTVTDATALINTVANGIGPGKAFGLGMLCVSK
jgi:CRISPR system Cascade subunit CasE